MCDWRRRKTVYGRLHLNPRLECQTRDIPTPRSRRAGDKDKTSDVLCMTEPGVPLLLYNQSVLLYQAKKYRSAMGLLETIFDNIELVPESISHRVCFLLLELHGLAIRTCSMSAQKCQDFKKSAKTVLTHLQKTARKVNDSKSSGKSDRRAVRAHALCLLLLLYCNACQRHLC